MRHLLILGALAGSVGAAWGQTRAPNGDCLYANGKIATAIPANQKCPDFPLNQTPSDNLVGPSAKMLADLQAQQRASRPGRSYTLDEIDRMRAAILRTTGTWGCTGPTEAETMLRTYIAAGISPEALEAKASGAKP